MKVLIDTTNKTIEIHSLTYGEVPMLEEMMKKEADWSVYKLTGPYIINYKSTYIPSFFGTGTITLPNPTNPPYFTYV